MHHTPAKEDKITRVGAGSATLTCLATVAPRDNAQLQVTRARQRTAAGYSGETKHSCKLPRRDNAQLQVTLARQRTAPSYPGETTHSCRLLWRANAQLQETLARQRTAAGYSGETTHSSRLLWRDGAARRPLSDVTK